MNYIVVTMKTEHIVLHKQHNILGTTSDCILAPLSLFQDQNMLKSKLKWKLSIFGCSAVQSKSFEWQVMVGMKYR